jgi:alkanesulfonate monooxygenase SsuD/methylene tetrahydromethanopterin reductase-like flavin-dependent oxidoreductase (luciferase family)
MKFIGLDLVANAPDAAGQLGDPTRRLSETVENAVRFEELGLDGFAVGERHHAPFLSSAPPVVLSHLAALTSRIRLFTGVTLLSVLDPVRVAEDYATVDHLSGGRVELIIGKGNGPEQAELFGIGRLEAWDTIAENYRLLRQLWSGHKVTWTPPDGVPSIRTTPLTEAEVHPQPLQPKIRIWHGSATAERSVELAVEFGDPVFSANGMNPVTRYAELIRHYRDRWAAAGRDPAEALVGAGHGQTYVTRTSQQAVDAYQPVYERFAAMVARSGQLPGTFTTYDSYQDFLERGSALVGSPQQVIDKIGRYHQAFGNKLIAIGGHRGTLSQDQYVASLELFAVEVVPALREAIPDPPWPGPVAEVSRRRAAGSSRPARPAAPQDHQGRSAAPVAG